MDHFLVLSLEKNLILGDIAPLRILRFINPALFDLRPLINNKIILNYHRHTIVLEV
jgi:hypothetical protein